MSRHRRLAHGTFLTALLTVLTLGYFGYHFFVFQVDYRELAELRETVQAQEEMAAQLQKVAEELNRLRSFDSQIRRLAGMETSPAAPSGTPPAVGGGTLELAKALKEGEQAQQAHTSSMRGGGRSSRSRSARCSFFGSRRKIRHPPRNPSRLGLLKF